MALNQKSHLKISKAMDADKQLLGANGINVENSNSFALQFHVIGAVAPLTGKIYIQASNDPTNAGYKTITTESVTIDTAGDNTYFIFIGAGTGINAVTNINFWYENNASGGGSIESVYFSGKQQ